MDLITINKSLKGRLFIQGENIQKLNTTITITGISPIDNISKNSIVYVGKEKYLNKALNSEALAILVPNSIKVPKQKIIIQCKDSKKAFIKLLLLFLKQEETERTIHKSAIIGDNISFGKDIAIMAYTVIENNVSIKDNSIIYPHCYIGQGCTIGKNSIIHPGVVIHERCSIGDNVIIQSKSVIGSDGFGYYTDKNNYIKIPHLGTVKIGNNVEIGSGVRIDRATLGESYIGEGSKIDNLVHIAHNCKIGKNCIIAGQSGLAGSVSLEDNVKIAGQVGIVDHCQIGKHSSVLAKSMVNHSLPARSKVFGYPERPINDAIKIYKAMLKLIRKPKNYFKSE